MPRKNISKKLRFEILKRDKFTCCYCGRKAPDVQLHIDHVVPVAKGGGNDPLNLIAACADCNGGKSDRELSNADLIEKRRLQAEQLQDRINAAMELAKWQVEMESIKPEIDAVNTVMRQYGAGVLTDAGERMIRKLLKSNPLEDIIKSIPVAAEKQQTGAKEFGRALMFECKKISDERERPGISAVWKCVFNASRQYDGKNHYNKSDAVDALWKLKLLDANYERVSECAVHHSETWEKYVNLLMTWAVQAQALDDRKNDP
jgi:hypothetical protein